MKLKIIALGSGSFGNSIFIELDNYGILLDVGYSGKELFRRLEKYSISSENIKNILITHDHIDHTKGAKIVANKLDIATYASISTVRYLRKKNRIGKKIAAFNSNMNFFIYKFKIIPFSISHDAIDPVGFIFCYKGFRIGFAMDLGIMNINTIKILKGCDIIILESNHDITMLKNSNRPYFIKKRILSKVGHLSNIDSMYYLKKIVTSNTKHILLGHISNECNSYTKIESLAIDSLREIGINKIYPKIMIQDYNSFLPIEIEI